MSPRLGGLGHKYQDLVISFCLVEGGTIPHFSLRVIQVRSENILLTEKTEQMNNLTGKYIMELSKLKHLQRYVTTFELDYRKF